MLRAERRRPTPSFARDFAHRAPSTRSRAGRPRRRRPLARCLRRDRVGDARDRRDGVLHARAARLLTVALSAWIFRRVASALEREAAWAREQTRQVEAQTAELQQQALALEEQTSRLEETTAELEHRIAAADEANRPLEETTVFLDAADVMPVLGSRLEPLLARVLRTGVAESDVVVSGAVPASPITPRRWNVTCYPLRPRGRPPTGVGVMPMSGYTDDEDFRRDLGAARYVFPQKPFTAKKVASTVRTLLDAD